MTDSTPFTLACKEGDLTRLKKLLQDEQVDVNQRDQSGWTGLSRAVTRNFPSIVSLLLQHNASVNAVDKYDHSALHCAAENGNLVIAQSLIQNGADMSLEDTQGYTALAFACIYRHTAMIK